MYILIDASCSKFFTHNSSYIQSFAEILMKHSAVDSIETWIGESADSQTLSSFDSPVIPLLRSPIYSFTKKNLGYYVRDKLINNLLKKFQIEDTILFKKHIANLIATFFYYQKPYKRIRRLQRKNSDFKLVLPSADGTSLRIVKYLIKRGMPINLLCVRTLNAENRGVLGVSDLSNFLNDLTKINPNLVVKIGWEIENNSKIIASLDNPNLHVCWAPIPPRIFNVGRHLGNPIRVGFLGAARRNKGFDRIPEIIESLVKLDLTYVVQLSDNAWEDYEKTLNKIKETKANIEFLDGTVSNEKLLQSIAMCDLLIMPYQSNQYKFAGSGILYQGADALVPTITFDNLGFSWDVKSFEIGATINKLDELPPLINSRNLVKWSANLIQYNEERLKASRKFLNLEI